MPHCQKLKTMVKRIIDQKLRSRKFDARNERIETGAVVTSRRGSSGEEKEFAVSGKQKRSVREETNAVSGTSVVDVQNRRRKPLHPLSHQHQEGRSASRKKDPPRHESVWEVQSTAVQRLLL